MISPTPSQPDAPSASEDGSVADAEWRQRMLAYVERVVSVFGIELHMHARARCTLANDAGFYVLIYNDEDRLAQTQPTFVLRAHATQLSTEWPANLATELDALKCASQFITVCTGKMPSGVEQSLVSSWDYPVAPDLRCTRCVGAANAARPLKRCARCHCIVYCSTRCQSIDWLRHRGICALAFRPTPRTVEADTVGADTVGADAVPVLAGLTV